MQDFLSLNNSLKRAFEKVYACRAITVIEPLAAKYDIGAGRTKNVDFVMVRDRMLSLATNPMRSQ